MIALHTSLRRASRLLAAACVVGLAACASGGGGQGAGTTPNAGSAGGPAAPVQQLWPIRTREHVDLWLHGFAMLLDDTTRVPLFKRGYREQMLAVRGRAGTQLDANRAQLRARFNANPNLALNAQFLALSFANEADLRRAIDLFLQANGDPQRAGDQQSANVIAFLAGSFATAADREWLRVFSASLRDEYDRFYRDYWAQQQRDRAPVISTLENEWQQTYRPKLQRFLNNTQQRSGEFILSLPLGGEGRTSSGGENANQIAVAFPERAGDAREAIYVFAHEVIGAISTQVVNDNTTPAQQREGVTGGYVALAQVRGGALLLQRVAPDLVEGYTRYYLRQAGAPANATLASAFPLPTGFTEAITRQLDVVLGGI